MGHGPGADPDRPGAASAGLFHEHPARRRSDENRACRSGFHDSGNFPEYSILHIPKLETEKGSGEIGGQEGRHGRNGVETCRRLGHQDQLAGTFLEFFPGFFI